jgi:N-acetyl-anhydromuramyl-L-alanine amidase AmpD
MSFRLGISLTQKDEGDDAMGKVLETPSPRKPNRNLPRPWTDEQIRRARKMIEHGIPKYQIDRYFGRVRGSTSIALARRDNPMRRFAMAELCRQYRHKHANENPQ